MNITICDDEQIFRDKITHKLNAFLISKAYPTKEINTYIFSSLAELETSPSPDLLLLDIGFGEETCIDVAKKLRTLHPEMILIIITSLPGYMAEGYDLQVFRYLLKDDLDRYFNRYMDAAFSKMTKIWNLNRTGIRFPIVVEKIRYIEIQKRVLVIHMLPHNGLTNEEVFYGSLQQAATEVALQDFLQIQRSYLVNPAHIANIEKKDLIIDDGTRIPINPRNAAMFRNKWFAWEANQDWNI